MPVQTRNDSTGNAGEPKVHGHSQQGGRTKLHFILACCPCLDPIERLWGLIHKHVTHNRRHGTSADFRAAILAFLREEVPRNRHVFCDAVTDDFRITSPEDSRILT